MWQQKLQINLHKHIAFGQLFSIELFKHDDKQICYYTGFPDYNIFKIVLSLLVGDTNTEKIKMKYTKSVRELKLCVEDQYFLTLIKLRQGFGYEHVSKLFGVTVSTVANIFVSWVNFMYIRLGSINIWPHRDILLANAPSNNNYCKDSVVIGSIDATEFVIQTPLDRKIFNKDIMKITTI